MAASSQDGAVPARARCHGRLLRHGYGRWDPLLVRPCGTHLAAPNAIALSGGWWGGRFQDGCRLRPRNRESREGVAVSRVADRRRTPRDKHDNQLSPHPRVAGDTIRVPIDVTRRSQ